IVGVVSGRDLHRARAKVHLHVIVDDNGQLSSWNEGMLGALSMQRLVPFILWIDSDGRITKHGLNSGSGHDNLTGCTFHWVLDWVGKHVQHTKLDLLGVVWNRQKGTTRQFNLVHLDIG